MEHLNENCWYLECPKNFCSPEEEPTKMRLNGGINLDIGVDVSSQPQEKTQQDLETERKDRTKAAAKARREKKRLGATPEAGTSVPSTQITAEVVQAADTYEVEDSSQQRQVPLTLSPASIVPSSSDLSLRVASGFRLRAPSAPTMSSLHVSSKRCKEFIINEGLSSDIYDRIGELAKQCNGAKTCRVHSKEVPKGIFVDLVIADLPDNLPVPNVGDSSTKIPSWNIRPDDFIVTLMDFADDAIHDDGAMFIIYSDDNGSTWAHVEACFSAYGFMLYKEWTGVNRLYMRSAKYEDKTTSLFKVALLVRTTATHPKAEHHPRQSRFHFRGSKELEDLEIDLERGDAIVNFRMKETQALNKGIPWRGPKEKDPTFLSSLILSATDQGDVVVDLSAATGKPISLVRSFGSFYLEVIIFLQFS
jgi:hypothetical protein